MSWVDSGGMGDVTGSVARCIMVISLAVVMATFAEVPPEINVRTDTVTVTEGETAYLNCNATGNPEANITWFRMTPDKKVESIEMTGAGISIVNVTTNCGGTYICEASNGYLPKAIASIEVIIIPAAVLTIRTEYSRVAQSVGKSVILECEIIDGGTDIEAYWFYNGEKLCSPNDDECVASTILDGKSIVVLLEIKNLQPEDYGLYTCFAQNSQRMTMAHVTLYELHTPDLEGTAPLTHTTAWPPPPMSVQTVTEGTRGFLVCPMYNGTKEETVLKVTWKDRLGITLSVNENRLTTDDRYLFHEGDSENGQWSYSMIITEVDRRDTGNYTCTVKTMTSNFECNIQLIVHVPVTLYNDKYTVISRGPDGQVLDYGLGCYATGFPIPKVQWLWFNNSYIQAGEELSLLGHNMTFHWFYCNANNSINDDISLAVDLPVPGPPTNGSAEFDPELRVIRVAWQPPLEETHLPLTGYTVETRVIGVITLLTVDPDVHNLTIPNIEPSNRNISRIVLIRAKNQFGYGDDTALFVMIPTNVPGPPTNSSAEFDPELSVIRLKWEPPIESVHRTTGYHVKYFDQDQDQVFELGPDIRNLIIPNITPGNEGKNHGMLISTKGKNGYSAFIAQRVFVPMKGMFVEAGSTITLPCNLTDAQTGAPVSGIKTLWKFGTDRLISFGDRMILRDKRLSVLRSPEGSHSLTITDLRHGDTGQYFCGFQHKKPVQWASVVVNVWPPEKMSQ